jgi:hypothetical protein
MGCAVFGHGSDCIIGVVVLVCVVPTIVAQWRYGMSAYVRRVSSLAGGLSSVEEGKARWCYNHGFSAVMAALYITKERKS